MEDILVGEVERLKGEVKKLDEDRVFWREESRRARQELCRVRAQLERREGEVAVLNGELTIAKMEIELARGNKARAEVEAEWYGKQRDEARAWARRLYRALGEIRGLAENEAYIYGYEVEAILNIVNKALGGK